MQEFLQNNPLLQFLRLCNRTTGVEGDMPCHVSNQHQGKRYLSSIVMFPPQIKIKDVVILFISNSDVGRYNEVFCLAINACIYSSLGDQSQNVKPKWPLPLTFLDKDCFLDNEKCSC